MADEIIKVIDALAKRFGIVVDWSNQNIIPYLQELCNKYINYEMYTSIIWIVINLCLCIIPIIFFVYLKKNKEFGIERYFNGTKSYEMRYCCYMIISVLLTFFITFIFVQIFDIVKCKVIPEKIIIEELERIYRNMK